MPRVINWLILIFSLGKKRSFLFTALVIGAASILIGYKHSNAIKNCLNRPQVGSYYYPWYTIDRWKRDENVLGKPYLGFYDSNNEKVIDQHLRWANQAGIDYLIYSWLGTNPEKTDEREKSETFIKQAQNSNLKIMPLYETPLALNQSPENIDFDQEFSTNEKAGDRFIKDMLYFVELATDSEGFLKINQCPRISIYLARNLVNSETYFKRLKQKLANTGRCLDLTADVAFWGSSNKPLARSVLSSNSQWKWLSENFSAVYGYNMYSSDLNAYGIDNEPSFDNLFIKAKKENQRFWKQSSNSVGMKYQYSIQPGYDDRALRGMNRPATPQSAEFLLRDWQRIFNTLDFGDHVLITSFNEWYEGTAIEPSKKNGLELIKKNKDITNRIKDKFCK